MRLLLVMINHFPHVLVRDPRILFRLPEVREIAGPLDRLHRCQPRVMRAEYLPHPINRITRAQELPDWAHQAQRNTNNLRCLDAGSE